MTTDSRSHLPDFCRLPRIAAVCGITQLAVILLFLSPLGVYPASLTSFLAASAFAQWLALASALLLCKAGPVLSHFSSPLSYALAATLSGMLWRWRPGWCMSSTASFSTARCSICIRRSSV